MLITNVQSILFYIFQVYRHAEKSINQNANTFDRNNDEEKNMKFIIFVIRCTLLLICILKRKRRADCSPFSFQLIVKISSHASV